jgi:hypothetical protein
MRTFPESIVLILSGGLLLNIYMKKSDILKKGIILGILIGSIRLLPINFGVHTILSLIVFGFMLFKISNGKIIPTLISTCQVWICLALSEGIYIIIATQILNIDFNTLTSNKNIESAIITLPSLIVLVLLVLLFRKINKRIKLRG